MTRKADQWARGERRFFIALGSGMYRDLPEFSKLPRATVDIAEMGRLFEGFGYQTVLAGLGQYDNADQIKQKLSHWSRDIALSPTDVVIVYFAGHGATVGRDRHYLCAGTRRKIIWLPPRWPPKIWLGSCAGGSFATSC